LREEFPPLVLLDEVLDRAENHIVPPPGDDDKFRPIALHLLEWANAVVHVSQSLSADSELTELAIGGVRVSLSPDKLTSAVRQPAFRPYVEYALLKEGKERIEGACTRLPQLLPLLITSQVNQFAARYLQRVATLYVWGMDVEIHVMCRAVLDAIMQELIPAEEALKVLKNRKYPSQLTLNDRLCLSRFSTPVLLDEGAWRVAFKLKEDGNDVIHTDVDHALHFPDALEAIRNLRQVLSVLPIPGSASVILNPIPSGTPCNRLPPDEG